MSKFGVFDIYLGSNQTTPVFTISSDSMEIEGEGIVFYTSGVAVAVVALASGFIVQKLAS